MSKTASLFSFSGDRIPAAVYPSMAGPLLPTRQGPVPPPGDRGVPPASSVSGLFSFAATVPHSGCASQPRPARAHHGGSRAGHPGVGARHHWDPQLSGSAVPPVRPAGRCLIRPPAGRLGLFATVGGRVPDPPAHPTPTVAPSSSSRLPVPSARSAAGPFIPSLVLVPAGTGEGATRQVSSQPVSDCTRFPLAGAFPPRFGSSSGASDTGCREPCRRPCGVQVNRRATGCLVQTTVAAGGVPDVLGGTAHVATGHRARPLAALLRVVLQGRRSPAVPPSHTRDIEPLGSGGAGAVRTLPLGAPCPFAGSQCAGELPSYGRGVKATPELVAAGTQPINEVAPALCNQPGAWTDGRTRHAGHQRYETSRDPAGRRAPQVAR